jgi:pyruvate formate lyase activating enzyme
MAVTLFTASGCTRCKIVKKFMNEHDLAYDEKDIKTEGKTDFQTFYRKHHKSIFRGPNGVEFPIYFFEGKIRQGLGPVLVYLQGGDVLDKFVRTGILHGRWVDGINVSRGDPVRFKDLLAVLAFLKRNGIKLEVETDGRNPDLLKRLIAEGMVDRGIMELKGPKGLYSQILNIEIDPHHIEETMSLIAGVTEYRFQTTIAPVLRSDEKWSCLTPEEVGETATWLTQTTGNNKHPYIIRRLAPTDAKGEDLLNIQTLAPKNLFAYRTKARPHQVRTEIEKQ